MVKELLPYEKEVVIVDDGSTDGTWDFLVGVHELGVHAIFQERNRGKGAAVRTGFEHDTGDVVVVQDAVIVGTSDQEYLPRRPEKFKLQNKQVCCSGLQCKI